MNVVGLPVGWNILQVTRRRLTIAAMKQGQGVDLTAVLAWL
jgi:hypothetical protein